MGWPERPEERPGCVGEGEDVDWRGEGGEGPAGFGRGLLFVGEAVVEQDGEGEGCCLDVRRQSVPTVDTTCCSGRFGTYSHQGGTGQRERRIDSRLAAELKQSQQASDASCGEDGVDGDLTGSQDVAQV